MDDRQKQLDEAHAEADLTRTLVGEREERAAVQRLETPDVSPTAGFDELGRPLCDMKQFRRQAGVQNPPYDQLVYYLPNIEGAWKPARVLVRSHRTIPGPAGEITVPAEVEVVFRPASGYVPRAEDPPDLTPADLGRLGASRLVQRLHEENHRLRQELLDRASATPTPLRDKVDGLLREVEALRRRAAATEARCERLQKYSDGLYEDNKILRATLKADDNALRAETVQLRLLLRQAEVRAETFKESWSRAKKTREYRLRAVPATRRELPLPATDPKRAWDLKLGDGKKLKYLLAVSVPADVPPDMVRTGLLEPLRRRLAQLEADTVDGPTETEIALVAILQGYEVQVFELLE